MNTHKRLYRSDDPVFAGVCGGLAEYFELDPTLIRILSVVLVLAGFGLPIVAYIIAIVLMPKRSDGYTDYIDVKPAPAQAYSAAASPNGASTSAAGPTVAPGGQSVSGGQGVSGGQSAPGWQDKQNRQSAPGTPGYASVAEGTAASTMGYGAAAGTSGPSGFAGVPFANTPPVNTPPAGASAAGATAPPAGAAGYASGYANANPAAAPHNPTPGNAESDPHGAPHNASGSSAWSCATPPGRAYTACNPQAYDAVNPADQATDESPSRHRFHTGIILGILLVGLGLLALLDTFLDISARRFWPLIIIIVGFIILCTPRKGGWSLTRAGHAISVVAIGFVLQLWTLGIVTTLAFELTFRYLWPVLLVMGGLFVIGSATEKSVFNLFGSLLFSAALLFGIWNFGQIAGSPFTEILNAATWPAFLSSEGFPVVQNGLGLLGR
jgi:phage shock protein C